MAKGFSPLIGLAVVVALAMVAVFGAMSLTNPAWAQEEGTLPGVVVEGADLSIVVKWDRQTDLMASDVEVRWKEPGEIFGQGSWKGDSDPFVMVAVGIDTPMHMVTVGDSDNPLRNGRTYEVQVRTTIGTVDTISELMSVKPGEAPSGAVTAALELGEGEIEVKWTEDSPGGGTITMWQVRYRTSLIAGDAQATPPIEAEDPGMWSAWMDAGDADATSHTVMDLEEVAYDFEVRSVATDTPVITVASVSGTPKPAALPKDGIHQDVKVVATSEKPGANPQYTVTFVSGKRYDVGTQAIEIKMEDFENLDGTDESDITMRIDPLAVGQENDVRAVRPEAVVVDGDEITITVPDFSVELGGTGDARREIGITNGDMVTIVFRQSAGITNPTEGGKGYPGKVYPWVVDGVASYKSAKDEGTAHQQDKMNSVVVPIVIDLDVSDNEAGRGETVTLTGSGYKNGTTLTFWRDANADGVKSGSEAELCSGEVNSDDVGSCEFVVNKPPFLPGMSGNNPDASCAAVIREDDDLDDDRDEQAPLLVNNCNFINAVDGRDNTATLPMAPQIKRGSNAAALTDDTLAFPDTDGELTVAEVKVAGEDALTDMYTRYNEDVKAYTLILTPSLEASPESGNPGETILLQLRDFGSGTVDNVKIAGEPVSPAVSQVIPSSGDHNFSIIIPDDVPEGKQSLQLFIDGSGDERITLTIGGPIVRATPSDVVPNQRISLVGTGFSRDADELESITIGGELIPDSRINDGDGIDSVSVDSGGNWSTSVDLPLTSATTAEGSREIRVRDDQGREGTILVDFPARKITITPESGRVGTLATVRGEGFPGKNDDGSTYNIQIVYDASGGRETTVSATADAGGTFEVQLTVPTSASIPSTNTVKVMFSDDKNINVVTTVTHSVPEGAIRLSADSGPRGTTVEVIGEGFKSFVPVSSVKVGALEVTPSPRPSTDDQGMMSFDITIPGLDNGIQTIEVKVGDTTASKGFTVRPSGVSAGDITESSLAVVNLGDNFVRSFNFNNDTKSWTFYSPEAPDDSTQTSFITGASYWILIGESQEVILNGKTRNLTCAAGSCWNQIVW